MNFPKNFKKRECGGNYRYLYDDEGNFLHVAILQWNSGKNKNFRVERTDKCIGKSIAGKGDAAQEEAIRVAYEMARK